MDSQPITGTPGLDGSPSQDTIHNHIYNIESVRAMFMIVRDFFFQISCKNVPVQDTRNKLQDIICRNVL